MASSSYGTCHDALRCLLDHLIHRLEIARALADGQLAVGATTTESTDEVVKRLAARMGPRAAV